jgi:tetratricopeptide (TPR) repeat protein
MEAYQLFFGSTPQVAYTAHIGGLLGGALIGFLLMRHTSTVDENIFEDKDEQKDEISPLMETALEHLANLEMPEARSLFVQVLEKAPANREALEHLFHVDKLSPHEPVFHDTTTRYIAAMLRSQESHHKILAVYREYRSLAKPPRLSPHLYVKIAVLFCSLGEPDEAAALLSLFVKKKPDMPGLPHALLQLAEAYRKKGMQAHLQKCRKLILARYPDSPEAKAVAGM